MNTVAMGGFKIVKILVKLEAFKLSHIKKLLNGCPANWTHFATYWIGMSLRKHRPNLATNTIPHSDYCPPFYQSCLFIYKKFCKSFPQIDPRTLTTKQFYDMLIQKHVTPPIVERKFPYVDFSSVWKDTSSPFLDPHIQSFLWKTVHQILPVNYDLWRHNISRNKYCTFCNSIETLSHLLCECTVVKPLWRTVCPLMCTYLDKNIVMTHAILLFNKFPATANSYTRQVGLYMLACSKYAIWICRNKSKYNNKDITSETIIMNFLYHFRFRILVDFQRLNLEIFKKYWCYKDIFCAIDNQQKIQIHI